VGVSLIHGSAVSFLGRRSTGKSRDTGHEIVNSSRNYRQGDKGRKIKGNKNQLVQAEKGAHYHVELFSRDGKIFIVHFVGKVAEQNTHNRSE
jgi:hypothetical protein